MTNRITSGMIDKMGKKRKRLARSREDKIIAGVIGGISEYYKIDATLVRIAWLVLVAFTGFVPGIIVYLVAMIMMH